MPIKINTFLQKKSNQISSSHYFGIFCVGALSALVVSPCVTAPLVGALTYIAQVGNPVIGAIALFFMGIGLGIPLILVSTLGANFLPKNGEWMIRVKHTLGILMLAVAIWMLGRIIPEKITMLLWAFFVLCCAIYYGTFQTVEGIFSGIMKIIGIALFVYAVLLFVGFFTQNYNPLSPIKTPQNQIQKLDFVSVKTIDDVKSKISKTKKPVMLDFYADWCTSCHEMDKFTFNNPDVKKQLSGFLLLRADVTKMDAQDRALQKYYRVIAPPTILFFHNGRELDSMRIVGEINAKKFLKHLKNMM